MHGRLIGADQFHDHGHDQRIHVRPVGAGCSRRALRGYRLAESEEPLGIGDDGLIAADPARDGQAKRGDGDQDAREPVTADNVQVLRAGGLTFGCRDQSWTPSRDRLAIIGRPWHPRQGGEPAARHAPSVQHKEAVNNDDAALRAGLPRAGVDLGSRGSTLRQRVRLARAIQVEGPRDRIPSGILLPGDEPVASAVQVQLCVGHLRRPNLSREAQSIRT